MITHRNGKRFSVSYTVLDTDSENSIVVSGVRELMRSLQLTQEDALSLLHGECRIKSYILTRHDEVEI